MSILTSVTNLLEPIKTLGNPVEECKQTKPDECGDGKHKNEEHRDDRDKYANNDDHRDDRDKHGKSDDNKDHCEKQAKNDDHRDDRDEHGKRDDHRDDRDAHGKKDDYKDDHSKHAKNDDHRDDRDEHGKRDDHKDDHSKHAKNDDCQQHEKDCQPQKDHCDAKPSDDCGPGAALAKFDFSHGNPGFAPDHSDTHAALASMSPDHALDYAIGQLGPAADHFDIAHTDVPADTSHDMAHHA